MQARLHPALALLCLFPLLLTAQSADILVSSRNTNSVKRYSFDGSYLGDFIMPNAGALTNPQDLLWLPDGSLLVTGIGNSAIKHYDGSSGTFLGNFSSGYNLDRPTKMSVGPDGALYVSQWGSTQNKIARFNLQTGVFIDEFTETGVPQGCGHYWDADGNLYVASFGQGTNGNVHRFAPDGSFLGIAINSAHLQGPVGMWVDENGDFMITDWTLGQVLRFGATGLAYEGVFISGMQNIEGFLIDDGRFIY
ncbi:MAG: hypothetical protein KDC75_05500, partial [Phaeodactylibacter sp.]|nr:hypothetical protein [Phaeodactylibacter sp.]